MRKFLILTHSAASNALGRALSMALVAHVLGDVAVLAYDDGGLWAGASQFPQVVTTSSRRQMYHNVDSWLRLPGEPIIWISKGIDPTNSIAENLSRRVDKPCIILDFDDDDAGLSDYFRSQSVRNRVTLNKLRRMHPERIRTSQNQILRHANALTYSTHSLRKHLGNAATKPSVRIPHVRLNNPPAAKLRGESHTTIGMLGTIRRHKGGERVEELLRAHPEYRLVTFENSGLQPATDLSGRWREIPARTPIDEAYALVDVTVLLMDSTSPAADVQFPAKLVDAMRSETPIVATETAAISEIALDGATLIRNSTDVHVVSEAIHASIENRTGNRAREIFEQNLTPEVAACHLDSLLNTIAARPSRGRQ